MAASTQSITGHFFQASSHTGGHHLTGTGKNSDGHAGGLKYGEACLAGHNGEGNANGDKADNNGNTGVQTGEKLLFFSVHIMYPLA